MTKEEQLCWNNRFVDNTICEKYFNYMQKIKFIYDGTKVAEKPNIMIASVKIKKIGN